MYKFLDRISEHDLVEFVQQVVPVDLFHEIDHVDRPFIYNLLFGMFGYEILYEKQIRFLMLMSLSDTELENVRNILGIKVKGTSYDVSVSIANIPWRVNSKVAWEFAEQFSISIEYLPTLSSKNEPVEIVEPYNSLPPLFDFQLEIVHKILNKLKSFKKTAFLVQLPTGAGKTRTVIEALVTYFNEVHLGESSLTILWLAHTEELCEQAIDTFKDVWQSKGKTEARLIRYWGEYSPNIGELTDSFIFASFQKMYNLFERSSRDFEKLRNSIRIIVVDEAHKSLAQTYKELINAFITKGSDVLIGLTATPGRGKEKDKENIELAKLFGKTLISADLLKQGAINILQSRKILSKINHISHECEGIVELSDEERKVVDKFNDIPLGVLKRLANNHVRNNLIISIVKSELAKGNKCIVFTCSVEHAKRLSLFTSVAGLKSAYISCDMRRGLRRKTIHEYRSGNIDVIYNFGVLSTGFDAPNIKTVVIARPTTSIVLYSQMIGRGLRGPALGGTEECNLIDIKDNFMHFGKVEEVYNYFSDYWN